MAQTKNATEELIGSMKGILAIHRKMLPSLNLLNKAQEKSLENQKEMIKLMQQTKPLVDTTKAIKEQAKAYDSVADSSKKATKETKETQSWLGKLIGDNKSGLLRNQTGGVGFMHRMMYGVSGYFILKNRVDGILSGVDKFLVRPLSGLKGEDEKQGMMGKMFFGAGGSYRKTQEQIKSISGVATGVMSSVAAAAIETALAIPTSGGGGFGSGYNMDMSGFGKEKGIAARGADKILNSKTAVKFSEFEKKALEFYKRTDKRQQILAKGVEQGKKFGGFLRDKGTAMMKKVITFVIFGITVFVMAIKVFTIGFIIMGVIFLIAKLMRSGGMDLKNMQDMGADIMSDIEKYGTQIYEGIMRMKGGFETMWEAIFGEGTIGDLLDGYLEVFLGLWETVQGLALIVLMPLFTLLEETIMTAYEGIKVELKAAFSEQKKNLNGFFQTLGVILMVIATIILAAATVFAIFAGATVSPIILVGTAVLAIVGLLIYLVAKIADIWPFADGGVTKSGMSLVGEKGPELVRLPKGSRVHSNQESKQMVSGGGGNNITVNVQGRIGASDSELRLIAQKVGQMINKEINRTTSSRGLGA